MGRLGLVLGLLGVAACGAGQTREEPGEPAAAPEQEAVVADVVPSAPPAFEPVSTWTFDGERSDGTTWTVSLAVGRVFTGDEVATDLDPALQAACGVDGRTDAAVPYNITMTSTTEGFPVDAAFQFLLTGRDLNRQVPPLQALPPQSFAIARSDGCKEADVAMTLGGTASLAASGEQSLARGLLVLRGWRSPKAPQGDPAAVADVWFGIPSTGVLASGGSWENREAAGPALLDLRDPDTTRRAAASGTYTYWQFPLDGTSRPDCGTIVDPPFSGVDLQPLCEGQVG